MNHDALREIQEEWKTLMQSVAEVEAALPFLKDEYKRKSFGAADCVVCDCPIDARHEIPVMALPEHVARCERRKSARDRRNGILPSSRFFIQSSRFGVPIVKDDKEDILKLPDVVAFSLQHANARFQSHEDDCMVAHEWRRAHGISEPDDIIEARKIVRVLKDVESADDVPGAEGSTRERDVRRRRRRYRVTESATRRTKTEIMRRLIESHFDTIP